MKMLWFVILLTATAAAQRVSVPATASLRGLSVVNNQVVWASGTEGTVIRTRDSGKSWSVMTVPGAEKLDFRGIHAFDADTAVIISSGPAEKGQARIYRTTDAGRNWKQVFEQKTPGIFLDAIAFWDRKGGVVLSDPVDGHFVLFITSDGGETWKQLPPSALPPALPIEGAFAASNSCLTVHGRSDVWFATGGASVARVFHSGDRGKIWTVAETPIHPKNSSSGIFSLAFANAKDGIAGGGDYQSPERSEVPNVLRTRDGGRTWQAFSPTHPPGIYFSSVALQHHRIMAAGIKGIWIHPERPRGRADIWRQASTENLNTLGVANHEIWAVGPKGVVLKLSEP
ncbi:MAG TPA: oxidoreductase [Candidatus Angelobacter sp.]|nr:oxidoreductase [Candidatus Angelobacter sp.]